MIPISIRRVVELILARYRIIVIGASVAAFTSFLIGVLAPYIYRSDAMIEVPIAKSLDPYMAQDSSDVLRIAALARSPRVLLNVAKSMQSVVMMDPMLMVPHTISPFRLDEWINGVVRLVLDDVPLTKGDRLSTAFDPHIMASLMIRHVRTDTDLMMRTIRVSYEAGTPELAKIICESLITHFLEAIVTMEQQKMQRQEAYLEGAIKAQHDSLKAVEVRMREMVEKYPQLSVSKEERRGASLLAQNYIEKQEALEKLDKELEANHRQLSAIRRDLASTITMPKRIISDVSTKIAEEIGELEFKILQYTEVSGYPEHHPEIKKLQNRIEILRKLLSDSSLPSSLTPGRRNIAMATKNFKTLYQTRAELVEKMKQLEYDRLTTAEKMKKKEKDFKELVKINFEYDSLTRALEANTIITGELYRELQKTRLAMASVSDKANVLLSPSLPVHSSNITVKRRTVFGFFVGCAIAISLIFLLDLLSPTLLSPEDLSLLSLERVGPFKGEDRIQRQVQLWFNLLARQLRTAKGIGDETGIVTVIRNCCPTFNWEKMMQQITNQMAESGTSISVILIRDPDTWRPGADWTQANVNSREIVVDDIPNAYWETVERFKAEADWVFVLFPGGAQPGLPVETLISAKADYEIYVIEVGKTSYRTLAGARATPKDPSERAALLLSAA